MARGHASRTPAASPAQLADFKVRYIILGAGAIGASIGARLYQAGRKVVLVARGEHFLAIERDGLHFAIPEGTYSLKIAIVDDVRSLALSPSDILILTTKSQDSDQLLAAVSRQPVGESSAGLALPILCAQNGVHNERAALRYFRRVYGICVMMPAAHLRPGAVAAHSSPLMAALDIGRYPNGIDELCLDVAADFSACSIASKARPQIMAWKYAKLLVNLGNALEAACGRGAAYEHLLGEVHREALACYAAAHITSIPLQDYRSYNQSVLHMGEVEGQAYQGNSSWQSLARATGSIEADYLNGEIALLGRLYGIPTPVNEMLQRTANQMAKSLSPPGSLTVAELEARLSA